MTLERLIIHFLEKLEDQSDLSKNEVNRHNHHCITIYDVPVAGLEEFSTALAEPNGLTQRLQAELGPQEQEMQPPTAHCCLAMGQNPRYPNCTVK